MFFFIHLFLSLYTCKAKKLLANKTDYHERMGFLMKNFISTVEVETSAGVREVTLTTRHFSARRIFVTGEINSEVAYDFVSKMLYLQNQSSEPITIYIGSPGGEAGAGLLMYDMITSCPCEVNIYGIGQCASMGAILLACGKKGHRFVLPHTKVMIHECLVNNGIGGSASSIKKMSDSIMETRHTLNEILAKHTGKSIKEIEKATSFDK